MFRCSSPGKNEEGAVSTEVEIRSYRGPAGSSTTVERRTQKARAGVGKSFGWREQVCRRVSENGTENPLQMKNFGGGSALLLSR